MSKEEHICYLCGQPLDGDITRDHVPPKQFYPKSCRNTMALNLFWIPAHSQCNMGFQEDEDYLVNSLGPLCGETDSGNALWADISHTYRKYPQHRGLVKRVFGEFEKRPSGIVLPPGMIGKRYDRRRVVPVVWKITRGLFFWERQRFLPESTPRTSEIILNREPPTWFAHVRDTPSRGRYPGVFDYKYVEVSDPKAHYWAMLLWNQLIITTFFHDPGCECDTCRHSVSATT